MKKLPNKIIFNLCLIVLVSACHKLDHNINIFESLNQKILSEKVKEDHIEQKIIVPTIDIVKKKITKKLNNINKEQQSEKFNIGSILGLSEIKLLKKIGISDFVKIEGLLKNHQYHFSKCFLDVFVIKKENSYFVDFVQIRPNKLKGKLNKQECLEDMAKKINYSKQ